MPKKRLIDNDFKLLFGNRLKEARESRGLTQETLGEMVYVSKPTISRYERGLVAPTDPDTLQRLADALDINPEYLAGISAFKDGIEKTLEKVDCADYIESKNDDEVRRIRRFISYINTSNDIRAPLKYINNKSILIKEIYATENVYFHIQLNDTDVCNRFNIIMHEKRSAVQKIRKETEDEVERDGLPFYPKISPTGTDNCLYPTHVSVDPYISEDIFLEYLYQAKSVEHYVEIVSFEKQINNNVHNRLVSSVRNRYRITFSEFKKQIIDIYGITVDMLLLANKHNEL